MKRIKIMCYFCMLILFIGYKDVLALDNCTTGELKRLKELANNLQFTYEYKVVDDSLFEGDEYAPKSAYFKITAHNLSSELKYQVVNNYSTMYFTNDKPTIDGFLNGASVKINITAYTNNLCSGRTVKTMTINLPYFNQFSLLDECIGYEEFKYCQEFGYFNIDIDKFNNELEKYKNNSLEDDEKKGPVDDIEFDYRLYIIIGLVILIILVSVFLIIINIKKKDSDL